MGRAAGLAGIDLEREREKQAQKLEQVGDLGERNFNEKVGLFVAKTLKTRNRTERASETDEDNVMSGRCKVSLCRRR